MILKRILIFLLVIFFSFLQTANFSLFGIKPNLALAAIIAASFFIPVIWEGIILILSAALILKFKSSFNFDILLFFLIGTAALFLKNYLPWRPLISCSILIIIATFGFYFILSPSLVLSRIFFGEIIYNIIFGILFFALLLWLKKKFF